MTIGRPTKYTPELADLICEMLADGVSLRKTCEDEGMPSKATVFRWLREREDFRDQYKIAKQECADSLIDEMLDIADDRNEDVQRSRVRIDARKWIAARLKPRVYGGKSAVEEESVKHIFEFKKVGPDEQVEDR